MKIQRSSSWAINYWSYVGHFENQNLPKQQNMYSYNTNDTMLGTEISSGCWSTSTWCSTMMILNCSTAQLCAAQEAFFLMVDKNRFSQRRPIYGGHDVRLMWIVGRQSNWIMRRQKSIELCLAGINADVGGWVIPGSTVLPPINIRHYQLTIGQKRWLPPSKRYSAT